MKSRHARRGAVAQSTGGGENSRITDRSDVWTCL
jgi:hypothetical protein